MNTESHATAVCPSPKVVLGGGTLSTSDQAAAVLTSAWPAASNKFTGYMYNGTWTVTMNNTAPSGQEVDGYAICAA